MSSLKLVAKANASDGVSVKITVSRQSAALLARIAAKGIYGRNPSEVAGRFVDKALVELAGRFVDKALVGECGGV